MKFTEAEAVQMAREAGFRYFHAAIVEKFNALVNIAASRAVAEVAKDAERWRKLMQIGIDSKGEFRLDVYTPSNVVFQEAIDASEPEGGGA